MNEEEVYCLRRADLERAGLLPPRHGILPLASLEELLALEACFTPRSQAEQDPAHKQVIPYQVFWHGSRILVFARGGRVGEQRLAGRLSVGIGGHVNRGDASGPGMSVADFLQAALRERHEELLLDTPVRQVLAGLVNDDRDAVGRVHLGVVLYCQVDDPGGLALRPGAEDLHFSGWWLPAQVRARAGEFEPWSLLALEFG